MQAITTKFMGASNHRPARVKASCAAGNLTVSYDYALSANGNHHRAASELVRKLAKQAFETYGDKQAWHGAYVAGDIGTGNAYIRINGDGTSLSDGDKLDVNPVDYIEVAFYA